jgi:enamine deaminase RidA (YjgF/YER057c/UK114 family)
MAKRYNPDTIAPPLSRYSHAVEAPASARWLHISGQVGIKPDGELAEGLEAQMAQAWQNVLALLKAADMDRSDLVKVTAFLTPAGADLALYRDVRDRSLGPAKPASTVVIVAGLAKPEYLVEIEAIAAAD